MDKIEIILDGLIRQDQETIKSFRNGEISRNKFKKVSVMISSEFLDALKLCSFPYKNLVSEEVYKAAITIALHLDLDDLKDVFNKYVDKRSRDEIDPAHWAMFVDKIFILSDKPQLYGTQYKVNDLDIELLPLQDPDHVDERRNKAGMQTLSEYLKFAKKNLKKK